MMDKQYNNKQYYNAALQIENKDHVLVRLNVLNLNPNVTAAVIQQMLIDDECTMKNATDYIMNAV